MFVEFHDMFISAKDVVFFIHEPIEHPLSLLVNEDLMFGYIEVHFRTGKTARCDIGTKEYYDKCVNELKSAMRFGEL